MIFIVINVLGFMSFSAYMALKPNAFADLVVRFSEKSWFHPFEIATRAFIGMGFWYFANTTPYPTAFKGFGILVIVISLGLLVLGADKHRAYALWSVESFRPSFKVAGAISFPLGAWLLLDLLAFL